MEDFENRAREVKKEIREKLTDLQGALQDMQKAFRQLGDTFDLINKTNGFSDMSAEDRAQLVKRLQAERARLIEKMEERRAEKRATSAGLSGSGSGSGSASVSGSAGGQGVDGLAAGRSPRREQRLPSSHIHGVVFQIQVKKRP